MSRIVVLKFGNSVLRTLEKLPVAVDEIYRHWRSGCRVLAVVSAFEGVTDRLFKEADTLFGPGPSPAAAAFVATGEQRTAWRLSHPTYFHTRRICFQITQNPVHHPRIRSLGARRTKRRLTVRVCGGSIPPWHGRSP